MSAIPKKSAKSRPAPGENGKDKVVSRQISGTGKSGKTGKTGKKDSDSDLPLRDRILKESLKIVAEEGAAALNMREVARRLKISHAAPYRHFENKEDVLAELGLLGFRLFTETLSADLPLADSKETMLVRFRKLKENYLKFASEHPELYNIIFLTRLPDKEKYISLREAGQKAFSTLLDQMAAMKAAGMIEESDVFLASMFTFQFLHGQVSLKNTGVSDGICHAFSKSELIGEDLERGMDRILANAWGLDPSLRQKPI
jgi:AcrR family transcriptional regulator